MIHSPYLRYSAARLDLLTFANAAVTMAIQFCMGDLRPLTWHYSGTWHGDDYIHLHQLLPDEAAEFCSHEFLIERDLCLAAACGSSSHHQR